MNIIENNSKLVIFAFISTIFFQITVYKFIWNIEYISRVINILIITIFSLYFVKSLISLKINKRVYGFYLFPGILVYSGYFINISLNSIENYNIINQYGFLIPWAVYLCIPGLMVSNKINPSRLWLYFNAFMLLSTILSIIEYYLLIGRFMPINNIHTSGGEFLSGYFSILYGLENEEIHYRFYSSFMEPGSLAMFLLPVIAYSFLYRKYFSLFVYCLAIYMTDSLGGFISLIFLAILLVHIKLNQRRLKSLMVGLFLSFLALVSFSEDIIKKYESKNASASVREDNIVEMIKFFPDLIAYYPFGMPLFESTDEAQKNTIYFGANFALGKAFNMGGVLSFTGYILVLVVSLWYSVYTLLCRKCSMDNKLVAASIMCSMPFIFQRSVIWDSSIFPLLFSPFIIYWLSYKLKMKDNA